MSGLGKISQLFFAWIQPGNIVANIIAGGVAEAGAQQYVDRPYFAPQRQYSSFITYDVSFVRGDAEPEISCRT